LAKKDAKVEQNQLKYLFFLRSIVEMNITWSNNIENLLVQYYFQLVRTDNPIIIENKLIYLLTQINKNKIKNINNFILLYKLIGHTRDIKFGKGEYDLSYMQIYVWHQFYPYLAFFAFKQFVISNKYNKYSYGSWKDIKRFCDYIKKRTNDENHPLILYACELLLVQLNGDFNRLTTDKNAKISLAGKWAPRQKSKYSWLFRKLAFQYYNIFLMNAWGLHKIKKAERKAKMFFRKLLSFLNRYLKTPQCMMASQCWSNINFENITSLTLHKHKKSFMKLGNEDRKMCAKKFEQYVDSRPFLPGKRCETYQLVRAAFFSSSPEEDLIINKQWGDNKLKNANLSDIIPILDTSIWSLKENSIPLYNTIGLGIRISENSDGVFKNRLLIFNNCPQWIIFDEKKTFVQKVRFLKKNALPLHNNFSSVLEFLLKGIINENLSIDEVKKLTFIILSGQHVYERQDIYSHIKRMFFKAGMLTMGVPYFPSRFIFWNLSKTNFFPASSIQENVAFFSGFNSSILNIMAANPGVRKLVTYKNPIQILENILSHKSYHILGEELISREFIATNLKI